MDYRGIELTDTAVSSWWAVHPANYGEQVLLRRAAALTLGGELRVWQLPGAGRAYSLPLRFCDSAFQAMATSWWAARTPLLLMFNRQVGSAQTALGTLVNLLEPFQQDEPGRPDLWRGSLQLVAAGCGHAPGLFFLCDDSSLGLTDQTYNSVLP